MRKKRFLAFLCLLALSASLVSCRDTTLHTSRVYAMGTYASLTEVLPRGEDGDMSPLFTSLLTKTEALLSHRREGSFSHRLNTLGYADIGEEDARLIDALRLCEEIGAKTDGLFSVSLLPLTSLWDFDAESPTPPSAEEISAALEDLAGSALHFEHERVYKTGGGIDLGAIGKGYACDEIADALRAKGKAALVSVGGSIAALGEKPSGDAWQIGVRDPFSSSQSAVLGTLSLKDSFVSTSGSYEKCFTHAGKTYHHILDPRTGAPAESDLVSVTAVATGGTLSDALSTACFLVGSDAAFSLAAEYGAALIAVKADGTLLVSESLRGIFSPKAGWEVLYR